MSKKMVIVMIVFLAVYLMVGVGDAKSLTQYTYLDGVLWDVTTDIYTGETILEFATEDGNLWIFAVEGLSPDTAWREWGDRDLIICFDGIGLDQRIVWWKVKDVRL